MHPFAALAERPVLAAVLGALSIAFSAVLVRLSGASPATAAIFRCAYALPFLAVIAWMERRAYGPRPASQVRLAWLAGIFFAIDLVVWHHTIEFVGAGLATVLGNTQVIIVALVARRLLGERPSNRVLAAMPLVLLGVVLISGIVGSGRVPAPSRAGGDHGDRHRDQLCRLPACPTQEQRRSPTSGRPALRRNLGGGPRRDSRGPSAQRGEPGPQPARPRLPVRPRAELAGGGLAADQRFPAPPAGRSDERDPDHPAGRIGPVGDPSGQ